MTGTLLQAERNLPSDDKLLAVRAPANTISVLRQEERSDPEILREVERYLAKINQTSAWKQLNYRWLNPHITTRIVGITPNLNVAEVDVLFDGEVYDRIKNAIEVRCRQCEHEKFTLILRGKDLFEFFNRGTTELCSNLVSAFRMSGHILLFAAANGCSNGRYVAQVQDVSGPAPKVLFNSTVFDN
jgi:hypothetical protein